MKTKTWLVSGAGSGIGRAIAQVLAQDAASELVLIGRNAGRLEETKRSLPNSERHGIVSADLRDARALREGFERFKIASRGAVGVIANAGVGGGNDYGREDRWDEVIGTNLTGTYQLIQEALPALRAPTQSDGGPYRHIVIVSSILARLGVPGYTAYCASKAGLLGLMRSLAVELAPEKILVNAVCPGWVQTEMAENGLKGIGKTLGMSTDEARGLEMSRVPLGKMSEPQEIARFIAFLVSGQQTSITGQTLDINNGALML